MMKEKDFKSRFSECSLISEGGQKKVYKVVIGSERYAFKTVNNSEDQRILQEIQILSSLSIRGVPKILDYGYLEDDNRNNVLYILEEFVGDVSLREYIKKGEYSNLKVAFELLQSLLRIVSELETHNIVHRDIKPDNIVIDSKGGYYLIDFGVAKILGASSLTFVGSAYAPHTPGYAPSEQIMNDRMLINSKTDLYQIGVTIYESITGVNPFSYQATNLVEVHQRTISMQPEPIKIEGDTFGYFSDLILMLMAKLQSQRPENAKRAIEYLEAIRDTLKMEE